MFSKVATGKPRSAMVLCGWLATCFFVLALAACTGSTHVSFLDPQGPIAEAQRVHFYWVLGTLFVLVAGPIFLLLPLFLWRYRYGNTKACYKPLWASSRLIETFSWAGPVVIVVVLAVLVARDAHRLDPYKPLVSDQAPLRIQVVGYDWKWLFIYPDQGIATVGTLALPAGRPVSLYLTSATVMQSFFIPSLGSQMYAMGGMVTQLNLQATQPGASTGENTMYNGDGFHQQKFTAQAMTPTDFDAWAGRVRTSGIPLTAQNLQIVAQRSTRSGMISALPRASSTDGDVYFTGVSPLLFPAVVMSTMNGKPMPANSTFQQADPASARPTP